MKSFIVFNEKINFQGSLKFGKNWVSSIYSLTIQKNSDLHKSVYNSQTLTKTLRRAKQFVTIEKKIE